MTEINSSDNDNNRTEYECNKKAEKIEYFILHGSWDNSWVTNCIFCRQCGRTFSPDTQYNVYKLKGLFFCGPCFNTLEKRHKEKGVILNAELYWDSLQSSPELQ